MRTVTDVLVLRADESTCDAQEDVIESFNPSVIKLIVGGDDVVMEVSCPRDFPNDPQWKCVPFEKLDFKIVNQVK